ncbi:MAG: hypothetical protein ACRDRU_01990, partial [Pseudonocardiaceae bacterium]
MAVFQNPDGGDEAVSGCCHATIRLPGDLPASQVPGVAPSRHAAISSTLMKCVALTLAARTPSLCSDCSTSAFDPHASTLSA